MTGGPRCGASTEQNVLPQAKHFARTDNSLLPLHARPRKDSEIGTSLARHDN